MDEKQNAPQNLFLGLEVKAPWPDSVPQGRIIDEASRHLTLIFLGRDDPSYLLSKMEEMPLPPFPIGPVALADDIFFLPENHPHVVSYRLKWLSYRDELNSYRSTLYEWFASINYTLDPRPFLPHVTVARAPLDQKGWLTTFAKLPIIITGLHLYQSHPNLTYCPIWSAPLMPPFTEIEHTGDIAFHIWGESLEQLYLHAQIALSFVDSNFLNDLKTDQKMRDFEEIVMRLNDQIAQLDVRIGSPFKAVSFSGDITKQQNGLLLWEMIVDV